MGRRAHLRLASLAACAIAAACAPRRSAFERWVSAPLAPTIDLTMPVPAGAIAVLVLDAHSGEPLAHAQVLVVGPPNGARTDSLGRATLLGVGPGRHQVRVFQVGYTYRMLPVTLAQGSGAALVVQLRRSKTPLEKVVVGTARP